MLYDLKLWASFSHPTVETMKPTFPHTHTLSCQLACHTSLCQHPFSIITWWNLVYSKCLESLLLSYSEHVLHLINTLCVLACFISPSLPLFPSPEDKFYNSEDFKMWDIVRYFGGIFFKKNASAHFIAPSSHALFTVIITFNTQILFKWSSTQRSVKFRNGSALPRQMFWIWSHSKLGRILFKYMLLS